MPDSFSTAFSTLLHASGAAQAHLESRLAACGLSGAKMLALQRLVEAGDSLPLGQLAERLSCVKSNVTQLVDRLEADGYVSREADPNDRRSKLAVITPEGRKVYAEGAKIQESVERDLFAKFSKEEALQLASFMARLEASAR
ncbi:MAG: MarR family winged helix-turn-helix transcriptional regulator [Vicinamibacterales bacterium]